MLKKFTTGDKLLFAAALLSLVFSELLLDGTTTTPNRLLQDDIASLCSPKRGVER